MEQANYQSSGQNNLFLGQGKSFNAYIDVMKNIIRNNRLPRDGEDIDKIVDDLAPFELKPNEQTRKGILLVHGLLDSPFSMRELGNFFVKQGFLVRSIILPGHGTRPGDLLDIEYSSWCEATQYGLESLQQEVDDIYFLGYSTGGLLGLYHAFMGFDLKKIFLLAPCVKIKTPFIGISPIHVILGKLWHRLNWITCRREVDFAKYSSIPFNAAKQVYYLTKVVAKMSKKQKLKMPMMMVVSEDDEVISATAAIDFVCAQQNIQNRIFLYSNSNNTNDAITNLSSAYPEEHILDFSHVGLACSANNFHYGIDADYTDFNHYPARILQRLKQQYKQVEYGALSAQNMRGRLLARLTYNPDYDNMLQRMTDFLQI